MGTRAQVVFKADDESPEMYFYQHSDGYELPNKVKAALARSEERWDDAPYLARVIFSEMVKDFIDEITGYGLSTTPIDSYYEIHVHCENKTVEVIKTYDKSVVEPKVTFAEYVKKELVKL